MKLLLKDMSTRRVSRSKPNGSAIVERADFAKLIRYERERAERTNKEFSLVCFDLTRNRKWFAKDLKEELLQVTASSIRVVDRIGWLEESMVGIILPDTPHAGALTYIGRLINNLNGRAADDCFRGCFTVCSYPDSKRGSADSHGPRDLSINISNATLLRQQGKRQDYRETGS